MNEKNNRLNLTFRNNKVKLFPKHKLDIFNHINTGLPTQAEATALFDRATALGSPFPDADKPYVNEAIYYLKQTDQWAQLDSIGKFDVHSRIAALIDWKNPSRSFTTAGDYTGDFTAYSGFKGNNTSFRIDTGLNFSTGAWNYTRNSAIKGVYVDSNETGSTKLELSNESASNAGITTLMQGSATPKTVVHATNNGSDLNFVPIVQLYGWQISKRDNSANYVVLKNGINISRYTKETASTAIPNANINLLCRNIGGVYSQFSTRRIKGFFAGGGSADAIKIVNGLNKHSLGMNSIPKKAVLVDGNSFTRYGHYIDKVFRNYGASNLVADFVQGEVGRTTAEMTADFTATIGSVVLTGYTHKVLFAWEVTNDMYANASNATTTYNNLVAYCQQARATFGSDLKIIVGTCLPRGGSNPITAANRQNPLDLYDATTLNGKIRNNADGAWDAVCDVASDATMGVDSGGVAGVGEKNTTYYDVDEIHPTTTGYQYLADNYIYASINAYL